MLCLLFESPSWSGNADVITPSVISRLMPISPLSGVPNAVVSKISLTAPKFYLYFI